MMLRLLATVAVIGYAGVRGTHAAVVAPSGQTGGGPSRLDWLSRIGQLSPGYTRLPLVTFRFALIAPPGLLP